MIKLTKKELMVLASLFGENMIYGFSPVGFDDLKKEVSEVIEIMQVKNLMDIDFGGYVHLPSFIYEMIKSMCYPEACLIVETPREHQVYYRKNDNIYQMIKNDDVYECDIYQKKADAYETFKESIYVDEKTIKEVKNAYEDFDFEKVSTLLNHREWIFDDTKKIDITYLEWQNQDLINEKSFQLGMKEKAIYECVKEQDGSIWIVDGLKKLNETKKMMFERGKA